MEIPGAATLTIPAGESADDAGTIVVDGVGPGPAPDPLLVLAATVADAVQTLPTPSVPAGTTFARWSTAPTGAPR